MYKWKINMKNGDIFIVKSSKKNSVEFINEVLGNGNIGITVNSYPLDVESIYKYGKEFDKIYKSNMVCIISSEVSSIEFLSTPN